MLRGEVPPEQSADRVSVSSAVSAGPTGGKSAHASETVEITTGGESVRVLRKCVQEIPPLEQKQGEPGHVAACWVSK